MNECMHVYGLLPEINITYLLTYLMSPCIGFIIVFYLVGSSVARTLWDISSTRLSFSG